MGPITRRSVLASGFGGAACAAGLPPPTARVVIDSGPWRLIGDFHASARGRGPAVLLLNRAGGDRSHYERLAQALAESGVASLRLDLRGHGESVNVGRFIPHDYQRNAELLSGASGDVAAGLAWLEQRPDVEPTRIGVVGASYSAEASAEAARRGGRHLKAYVFLSPGSLSEATFEAFSDSDARWLIVAGQRERQASVRAALERAREATPNVDAWALETDAHATDLLIAVPGLALRLSSWFAQAL